VPGIDALNNSRLVDSVVSDIEARQTPGVGVLGVVVSDCGHVPRQVKKVRRREVASDPIGKEQRASDFADQRLWPQTERICQRGQGDIQ
jgi:hypothetical protein